MLYEKVMKVFCMEIKLNQILLLCCWPKENIPQKHDLLWAKLEHKTKSYRPQKKHTHSKYLFCGVFFVYRAFF
jgi:hypothetical protein